MRWDIRGHSARTFGSGEYYYDYILCLLDNKSLQRVRLEKINVVVLTVDSDSSPWLTGMVFCCVMLSEVKAWLFKLP